jgi:mannosylglucosylglycerate synthase
MPTAALLSFRLGGGDGVAIEAAKWGRALGVLGWEVTTVAGAGPVDLTLPGLAIDAEDAPTVAEVEAALAGVDLVVVENLCSLPLNPRAAAVVAAVCAGRPTVLHHHDLPWQRAHLSHFPPPPDDRAWAHVTINQLSRSELSSRGFGSNVSTIYNTFDAAPPPGDRTRLRHLLGVGEDDVLLLQPTRALPRKNIPAALALAEATGGVYWLLGPAEDGYGPELDQVVASARCPVILGEPSGPWSIGDAYSASDVVLLPSSWEGFGNPSIESATHRRPLAIGPYPVAAELAAFGFHWFDALTPHGLVAWLAEPDPALLEHNHSVAARYFNEDDLPARLSRLLESVPGL